MNSLTDQQLLRDYTGRRSEAAFAELVRRHVDFVYSAVQAYLRRAHKSLAQVSFIRLPGFAQRAFNFFVRFPSLAGLY